MDVIYESRYPSGRLIGPPEAHQSGEIAIIGWNRIARSLNDGSRGIPSICLEKSGYHQWIPLKKLSSDKFLKNRGSIAGVISQMDTKYSKLEAEVNIIRSQLELTRNSVNELCNNIPKNILKDVIGRCNEDNILAKVYCSGCETFGGEKQTCIHSLTCTGHCNNCFKIDDGICSACGELQKLECPVCTDSFEVDEMMRSSNCIHAVCWSCIGKSHYTSRPIKKCPCCRVKLKAV